MSVDLQSCHRPPFIGNGDGINGRSKLTDHQSNLAVHEAQAVVVRGGHTARAMAVGSIDVGGSVTCAAEEVGWVGNRGGARRSAVGRVQGMR